jgi:ribonuclease D
MARFNRRPPGTVKLLASPRTGFCTVRVAREWNFSQPPRIVRLVIDTEDKLSALLPALRAAPWIALDTEADSLHAYPEKLCLLQISSEGVEALVDPLTSLQLAPLMHVLGDHELIMHGSDYDLRLLRKTFDFTPKAIFDTMLAARLLGLREFGLGHLVAKYLNVKLEKGPQKADWARRPLTPRMEEYARNDTRFLKPLSDLLRQELRDKGRLAWHEEYCRRLIKDCSVVKPPDPEVWRVKGSFHLGPNALAVLRSVWYWREKEAVAANRPPYFILQPETMIGMAIAAVEGRPFAPLIPKRFSPRRYSTLIKAVEHGLQSPDKPQLLRTPHYRQNAEEKRRYHELEKVRDKRAHELGIDPTIIASRAALVQLARDGRGEPEITLMDWQNELLK